MQARTQSQFFQYLRERGYEFKFGKDITAKPPGKERGLKLARKFGEDYTLEAIQRRILENTPQTQKDRTEHTEGGYENQSAQNSRVIRDDPYKNPKHHYGTNKTKKKYRLSGSIKKTRKLGGLRGLYFYYCYKLGILPKDRPPVGTRQLHFLLREDLRRLDTISKETRLLCHYHIDTADELAALKEDFQSRISQLEENRQHLRYKCRNIKDEGKLSETKEQISALTKEIGAFRKEVVLCDGIAVRSGVISEKLKTVRQMEGQRKEEGRNEHIRRGG